ncbi:MAG: hypothetical protein OXU66_16060 [Gammaproteobacteria bacterium]|nr:hypothetical protein [Gammaproteobacteria bacterium]MDD9960432.1 hypothetical protein [Gammaproteobacteria bacterium]
MPEFFTGIGELLSGSFLQSGALWTLTNVPGFPPIIQTVHILGIAVVMGTIAFQSLRILGLAIPSQTFPEITQRVMPIFWIALVIMIWSGSFFVFGRPNRYFNNPVFLWKMSCLAPLLLMMLFYQVMSKTQENYWQINSKRIWVARGIAALSILLILTICTAGRWIAYLEYIEYPLWYLEPYHDGQELPLWDWVQNWSLSQIIASTNWFPTIETIHVIAASLMVGAILWVDLRLIGIGANKYSISSLNKELVPWAWGAFTIAVITGLGMFITRASGHVLNPAFQSKMVLLILAGINMAYFHFKLFRNIDQFDDNNNPPNNVKLAGFLSLFLWSGVMLAGRWVGHII